MEHDRIFSHFGQFFALLTPNNPKNQNFEKMKKKTSTDIITLQTCTKNHDHMLHCSSDMACDRCTSYFSLWAIFCPFNPLSLTAQKINLKKKKKMKKHMEKSSFYTCAPKILIR